jgi:hypothetical protein
MVFTQIWYLHKQGLQDQNKGITNYAEFTLQWRNYPIWRYSYMVKYFRISSYIRNPFLIYDFTPDHIWISSYKRIILFSFYQCKV